MLKILEIDAPLTAHTNQTQIKNDDLLEGILTRGPGTISLIEKEQDQLEKIKTRILPPLVLEEVVETGIYVDLILEMSNQALYQEIILPEMINTITGIEIFNEAIITLIREENLDEIVALIRIKIDGTIAEMNLIKLMIQEVTRELVHLTNEERAIKMSEIEDQQKDLLRLEILINLVLDIIEHHHMVSRTKEKSGIEVLLEIEIEKVGMMVETCGTVTEDLLQLIGEKGQGRPQGQIATYFPEPTQFQLKPIKLFNDEESLHLEAERGATGLDLESVFCRLRH